jgi:hypothetical protein
VGFCENGNEPSCYMKYRRIYLLTKEMCFTGGILLQVVMLLAGLLASELLTFYRGAESFGRVWEGDVLTDSV